MVAALLLCVGGTAGLTGGRRVLGKAGGILWRGNRSMQHGQGRQHPVVHELGQGRPAIRAQQGHGVGQKVGGRGARCRRRRARWLRSSWWCPWLRGGGVLGRCVAAMLHGNRRKLGTVVGQGFRRLEEKNGRGLGARGGHGQRYCRSAREDDARQRGLEEKDAAALHRKKITSRRSCCGLRVLARPL
jgi:hypothetical protein